MAKQSEKEDSNAQFSCEIHATAVREVLRIMQKCNNNPDPGACQQSVITRYAEPLKWLERCCNEERGAEELKR